MKAEEFNILIEKLHAFRKEIVDKKRPEYTEGREDVLHNFKTVAAEIGVTPIQAWYIYFRKHIMSISQFGKDPKRNMAEPIIGRIADAMNYLELLYALIEEEKGTGVPIQFGPEREVCPETKDVIRKGYADAIKKALAPRSSDIF